MLRRFLFACALFFPLAAHAQLPCSAYPNTLTNGTLADANQVMANFNTIRNCVNSLAPLAVPVIGSSSNIAAGNTSASASIGVLADTITVGTALNGTPYTLTSYSQSFNGATTGAGGMDTGTLPPSTFVALYAIYNPTAPTISILGTSCASSCGTIYSGGHMPAGYTASALLTTLPTTASNQFPGTIYVKGKHVYYPGGAVVNTATSHGSATSVSLTGFIPPNAITLSGNLINNCGTTPGNTNVVMALATDSSAGSILTSAGNCASVGGANFTAPVSDYVVTTPQNLWYVNTVAGTSPSSQFQLGGYTIPAQ